MDERRGERDFLGHTGGVVGDSTARRIGQIHGGQQVLDAGGNGFFIDSVQVTGVGNELLAGELIEEMHAVG